jgi:hypothetical protein
MCDCFNTENLIDTEEKKKWYFRKKSIWIKIKEFIFGKETVDKHFNIQ